MCLIAHRPAGGARLPAEVISHNRRANPDGFGLAWRLNGRTHVAKFAPKDVKSFEKQLRAVDSTKAEYTAHWRYATHGAPSKELSHPFEYTDPRFGRVLVFHNGVINMPVAKGQSDSEQFVKQVLAKLPSGWWEDAALVWTVEQSIGWSRLLLSIGDTVVKLGNGWLEDRGIWYSIQPCPVVPKDRDLPVTAGRWVSQGHEVDPVDEFDMNEEVGGAYCLDCGTDGQWYVIDGKVYLDIKHIDEEEPLTLVGT